MSGWFTDLVLGGCAAAFCALGLSLRPGSVTGLPRLRLRLASLFMVVWALASIAAYHYRVSDPALAQLVSLALAGIWIWQLEPFAASLGLPRSMRLAMRSAGGIVLALTLVWMLVGARGDSFPGPSPGTVALLGVTLCVFGVSIVEQLYRNAPPNAEQAMRWLCLGFGGLLLVELVVFAETLVLGAVSAMPGTLRGAVYGLCALAMIRGAHRMPQWSLGLSLSRRVAFYTSSFMLVGAYLTLMALMGWLMLRYAGRGEGVESLVRLLFVFVAAAGLGLSLFARGLFRALRVLISTHFYPHRYDYRAEWIRFSRTMADDDRSTSVPQRAIRALAEIAGSPAGRLWSSVHGTGAFRFSASWPGVVEAAPLAATIAGDDPLPLYLERTAWLVDLAELARRPDLYGGLTVSAQELGVPWNALIVPLLHVDVLYGWIVLEREPGKGDLDFEDRDLLKIAGRQVAAHLAQLDADARLAEAHQFETYNRMTAFVMHDLKNIAAQLRLISQNAERHRSNPEFVNDAFGTVASAAARMSKLISQLTAGRDAGTMQTLDLAACAERAAVRCGGSPPVPRLVVDARPTVIADRDNLTAVIEHAIRNAQDATASTGEVRVEVGNRGTRPMIAIVDTGSGMDVQFVRDRLFRPFDTTKGEQGMGIGAFQVREYLRSLGGDVEVASEPGRGTRFTLLFAEQSILPMDRKVV